MLSKRTIKWLLNGIWCYLFFACFESKIGLFQQTFVRVYYILKVNESRYKQCEVTPHISTRKNLLKNLLRKDKNWQNQLRKAFSNLLKKLLRKNKYWHNQLRKAFFSKIYWKSFREKINIDINNWGKLLDRSADHK